jgi:hypothetical protein
MTNREWTGVWLSDVPLDANEGAIGDVLLRLSLKVPARDLRFWEWQEEGKPYREFLVPAELINSRTTKLVVAEGALRDLRAATDVFGPKVTRDRKRHASRRPQIQRRRFS